MNIPDDYKDYKLSVINEGSRYFFATNSASNWDFQTYYEETHSDLNKSKKIKKIAYDYDQDLHWISNLQEIPDVIKEYVSDLSKQAKPTNAQLKANLAKRATKKRKVFNNGMTFNGPIKGGIFNTGVMNNTTFNGVSNSQGHKRSCEGDQGFGDDSEESDERKISFEGHEPGVGIQWLKFIKEHHAAFHPYSPEANNIIRSGKGISPRPYLDRNLYNKHMDNHEIEKYPLPSLLRDHLNAAINTDDLAQFKKEIRRVSSFILTCEKLKQDDIELLEFLEEFLVQVYKGYEAPFDHDANEGAFNQAFVWPYLDLIGKNVKIHNCKGYFVQGQPCLESMSRQLKATGIIVDEKSQYKTDGLIKLFGLKNLELLLLETSGHFSNTDKVKIKLDNHKGMFGILAMLKCIADYYSFASVESFSQIKVFFLQAAETKLHLWSVRYQDGLFDFWRESCIKILPDFEDRMVYLQQLVQFCWNTKCLLEKAVENINVLKQEHQANSSEYIFHPEKYTPLSDVINPVIIKLTKEEDSAGLGNLGPMFSPSHD